MQSRVPVRYVKALYNLAEEKKCLQDVQEDMDSLFAICTQVNAFTYTLGSPIVKTSIKEKLVKDIFESKYNEVTYNFLRLLIKNKREEYLTDIARYFRDYYKQKKGILTATLTTAVKVDSGILRDITEVLKRTFNTEVEMSEITNKEILGGFILKLDDKRYNAAISHKLKKVKTALINKSFDEKFIKTTD